MIINVSYSNKQTTRTIEEHLGKPFTLKERFQKGGVGSPRLVVAEASVQINNLLQLDNNRNYCNIELRPDGILVGFRALLESYALLIPYYKLVIYKSGAKRYSIYKDDYFVRVEPQGNDKSVHKFMAKLMAQKSTQAGTRIEDL